MKKVTIYGTLGPACSAPEILRAMFREGMDGVRLNLSHTTLAESAELVDTCRAAARAAGVEPELLIDMQGPELRIGSLEAPIELPADAVIDAAVIPFPPEVRRALEGAPRGQRLLLDDGKLLLETAGTGHDGALKLRVLRGGSLTGRKSAALPGRKLHMPALTARDREQLKLARAFGVTAVMQPFVRSREDLMEVRSVLDAAGGQSIRLLAKIENREGVSRAEELIPHCDELVIARGDLGNAMELWELPAVQKRLSALCRGAGRDFMVVTQMLDSMIHRAVPTRAEVSDIFNAVLDGAASVMVTGETAVGEYPVRTIRYLVKTVRAAEAYLDGPSGQTAKDPKQHT